MYYVAAIVLAASLMQFLLLPIYIRLKNRQRYAPLKMTIKGLMTLIAFGFALYGVLAIYSETGDWGNLITAQGMKTSVLLPIGIFVCAVADVVLCVNFPVGMLLFLTGHIFYISYFMVIAGFTPYSLIPLVMGITGMQLYFGKYTKDAGKMKILYTVYGVMIMTTLSQGIVLPFRLGAYGVIPGIAVILLVVSDIMLGMNKLHKRKVTSDLMYLGYYFMGQFFLALSVFVPAVLGV